MRVIRITANLRAPDIAAARAFYTDYLGLRDEEFNLGWVARYTAPDTGAARPAGDARRDRPRGLGDLGPHR